MNRYTVAEVDSLSKIEVFRAYRFWPMAETEEETRAIDRLRDRVKEFGGWTPAISKEIGWKR